MYFNIEQPKNFEEGELLVMWLKRNGIKIANDSIRYALSYCNYDHWDEKWSHICISTNASNETWAEKCSNSSVAFKIANLVGVGQPLDIKAGDLVKYHIGVEFITTQGFCPGQVYAVKQDDGGLFVAVNSNKVYLTNGYYSTDSINQFILHQEVYIGRTCSQCDIGYHSRCSGGDCDCCGSGK